MKQATGELNTTVFVAAAVGILIAFFYYAIWPMIKGNFNQTSQCSKAICAKCETGNCKTVKCYLPKDSGNEFECPYKG